MCLECLFLPEGLPGVLIVTVNTRAGAVTFCTSLEVNSIRGIRLKNLRSSFSDWISLSQHDDLTLLKSWSAEQGGHGIQNRFRVVCRQTPSGQVC